jgi:murein hydrolase activator
MTGILLAVALLSTTQADSLDTRLEETRTRVEELTSEHAAVADILAAIHDHMETVRALYNELAFQESEVSRQLHGVQGDYLLEDSLHGQLEESLASYILYLYAHRSTGGLASFFAEGGFSRMLRRQAYVDYLASRAASDVFLLNRSRDSLEVCRDSLQVLLISIQRLRTEMQDLQLSIFQEEQRQSQLRTQLSSDMEAAQESISTLEAARLSRADFVTRLSASAGSTATQGTELIEPGADSYMEVSRGELDWPASGRVVRGFGVEINPTYGTETYSDGVTVVTAPSEPVCCTADGAVLYAREFLSMGKLVVIDHEDGYYTVYGYLDQVNVSPGDRVVQGSAVGRVGPVPGGQPGYYFEIRRGGVPVDPAEYLD